MVPTYEFGCRADEAHLVGADEVWVEVISLERTRGHGFESWRYLDTLDRPPSPGSKVDVVEAWLARPDESPFPPLDTATRVLLDSMVMFAAP